MPANVADALVIRVKFCLLCILMRNEACLF